MLRQVLSVCLIGLLSWLASVPATAAEEVTPKRHFIMGGSALQLRGFSKQDADTTFNVDLADLYKQSKADWSVEIVIYPDAELLLQAFDKGEVDGYFGTPLDYLARKDKLCKVMTGLKYRMAPLKQPLLILTRVDAGVTKISELKNKKLTLAPYQDVEALYLNTILLRNQLPEMQTFFSEQRNAKSTNIALMDVFFNKADITVVRENEYNIAVELNPQLAKKLTVLSKSEPILTTLGAINHHKITEQEFTEFLESFNQIVHSKKGEKLLGFIRIESVAAVFPDDMSTVESLLDEQAALRKIRQDTPKKIAATDKAN